MNNYKKFAAKFWGVELMIIALANIFYYWMANNQEPGIVRVQDKNDAIYKIIYTQTDYRTWILMDIVLGILFLLSVFLICYIGKKIIKPFEQMQSLTEELAKGNYTDLLLKGDADRLIEVLQNLLENAIKYGDGKRISIDFSEEEDCRLITVRNSGCSLKQEELVNLFDSFYRGSNVGSADGSGLGLYISRQLMQKMDGEVFAEIKEDDFCATVVVRKA